MAHSRSNAHPESQIPHVGTYRRAMNVSLERMYENALDWEHLPYVHSGSFSAIECLEAGSWGWRAALKDDQGRDSLIELRLDREARRWITRNIEGAASGSEIWTHVFVTAERSLEIVVDFFVPGSNAENRGRIGDAYINLYHQLYDEDEAMMLGRQRELDRRIEVRAEAEVSLPPRSELQLPHAFDLGGRAHVLREIDGALIAHAALCPHQLGPLTNACVESGEITCPWHGYRFRLSDGQRVNPQSNGALSASNCALRPAPSVEVSEQRVRVISRA